MPRPAAKEYLSLRSPSLIPLPHWHHEVELGVMRQMRHVGHTIRRIAIESLKIVLMGTHNHQVRANVEFRTRGVMLRLPGAEIHVRDADAIDLRGAAGEAVLDPTQKYRVEARRLIMPISRNRRKASPFVGSFAKQPVFTSGRRGPIAHSRVLVMNAGPARSASAIFSASVTGITPSAYRGSL